MSLSDENIALFDRYRRGELSPQEKAETEQKLMSDPSLKEIFRLYNISVDTVKAYGIGEEIGDLIDNGYQKKKQMWLMAAAAAVILMIAIPALYITYFRPDSNQDLYIAYYSPFPADQHVRGTEQSNEAMHLYRTGNYAEAIPLFEAMINSGNDRQRIHLLLGNCYLNVNDLPKAIVHFEESLHAQSRILSQNGEWYLALAYIKQNNTKKAVEQLDHIASSPHVFQAKAKRLLQELQ